MEQTTLHTDYRAVYGAWCRFRKGKQPSPGIDAFAYSLEANIAQLTLDIQRRTYRHAGYQAVILHEKKRRDLAVATVRDRVVHRLLYDYLLERFDSGFDPDVWSCRINRGLHKCLTRTQALLQRYQASYVWRADITKFFDSVDHRRLMDCLDRKIGYDPIALRLCQQVTDSYSVLPKHGIPIGNLTSQIFSNIYLNEFDRFIRHSLKPQAYIRYGDDFLLFCPNQRLAHTLRDTSASYLQSDLHLSLNPKNDVIVAAKYGLKFLGHAITENFAVVDRHTTKDIMTKVTTRNISSYQALPLIKSAQARLPWILLEEDPKTMFDNI
jgi:RNA-directed DNA polymerase